MTDGQENQAAKVVPIGAATPGEANGPSAGQLKDSARRAVRVVERTAEATRTLLAWPTAASNGMLDVQQAVADLVGSVTQANLRMAQDLFRATEPTAFAEAQQRCARECIGAFAASGAHIVRSARHRADEALRPLEDHLEQRRREQAGLALAAE